jgi:hypothetical protein
LAVYGNNVVRRGVEAAASSPETNRNDIGKQGPLPPGNGKALLLPDDDDDDGLTEDTLQNEEDVVRDAFRFLDGSEIDVGDDEDEVVYMRYSLNESNLLN